jgi:poly-gamma-glutamate capsule biosynthesis protein CapA/YwtB (metallophosphatase superfamily)
MTITLTGQSMIRGDTRIDAPETIATIQSLIRGDLAFTNFEAAVFDPDKGQSIRDGRFAAPAASIEALQSFGFNMLALANNHSFDIDTRGIENTLETAERLGISHAGIGRDMRSSDAACFLETPQGTVGLVAFASGLINEGRASGSQAGVNELGIRGESLDQVDARRILHRIRATRERADIVIVSQHNHHYPGVERPADFRQLLMSQLPARLSPPAWLEPWARQLVDAGADVVVMHGPPLLHGMEVYKGTPIFYSLGNFIFQVPPESIQLEEPIMWESVVAYVDFEGRDVKAVRFQPIAMNKIGKGLPNPHDQFDVNEYHRTRGLPRPAEGKQAQFLLERFAQLSSVYGTEIAIKDGVAELVMASRGR